MTAVRNEAVILCEGYDDRSFWSGWLRHLGCRTDKRDPKKGVFRFTAESGTGIWVRPVDGRSNLALSAEIELADAVPPKWLVLNLDADGDAGLQRLSGSDALGGVAQRIRAQASGPGEWVAPNGCRLVAVVWTCADPPREGLPDNQDLERLVLAAIGDVYPGRLEGVAAWLGGDPIGESGSKAHAWSHYAKWQSKRGTGNFYESFWDDPPVVEGLRRRLEETGAWQRVVQIVR